MNTLFIIVLHCCLTAVSHSAPLKLNSDFVRDVEHAKSLVKKILSDIPAVHGACVTAEGLSLEASAEIKNLEYITAVLDIPPAPKLVQISETHTLEVNLANMAEGLQLHQLLLQDIKGQLKCVNKLTPLIADIRDLAAQVYKVQQAAGITNTELQALSSSLSTRLNSDYQVQVATHLVLQQLRRFGQDVFRSLRHIAVNA